MNIVDQISVPLGIDTLWEMLTKDFEQVAYCLPGLKEFTGEDDNRYRMAMMVKVGPVTMNFVGQLVVKVIDASNKILKMESAARDPKMASSTTMNLTIQLKEDSNGSLIIVDTEVDVRGKVASLGWGMIQPKAKSLMKDFAKNLKGLVTEPST
ncbi:CoxG family protein [Sulfobacillus thermosulfidooxidans]|uniref:CoxG family protein n=1 Tax=Sulfobacillus thermosulfidooxidans TaxID=28034 RepID=UPI0006B54C10|nr:SRPBCC family protein [Sulfobacillus thermosulfidooxidans]